MRILIVSGLSASDIGGPAQYGPNLKSEFQAAGHGVRLISYGRAEKLLPVGLRHMYFFARILPAVFRSDWILALDTLSVGVPAVLAARIFRKRVVVRVGGDFLWESYVNRKKDRVTLPEFYRVFPEMSMKERIILLLTKFVAAYADLLAFNTEWQRSLWQGNYAVRQSVVVRNVVPAKSEGAIPKRKNFLWAGRDSLIKNVNMLKVAAKNVAAEHPEFELEISESVSREELMDKVRKAYALVLPSLSDVCPNFVIEGISFNKPFVMTKETGLGEIYPEGGIFFDPLDQEELERALEAMLDFRIYNKAVEDLKNNPTEHSWKSVAEELVELWKQK